VTRPARTWVSAAGQQLRACRASLPAAPAPRRPRRSRAEPRPASWVTGKGRAARTRLAPRGRAAQPAPPGTHLLATQDSARLCSQGGYRTQTPARGAGRGDAAVQASAHTADVPAAACCPPAQAQTRCAQCRRRTSKRTGSPASSSCLPRRAAQFSSLRAASAAEAASGCNQRLAQCGLGTASQSQAQGGVCHRRARASGGGRRRDWRRGGRHVSLPPADRRSGAPYRGYLDLLLAIQAQ